MRFADWRARLASALESAATRIEHVGSTAVPGLAAKPIVDVQVSVADAKSAFILDALDDAAAWAARVGWQPGS